MSALAIDWRAVAAQHQERHPLNSSHTDDWTPDEEEFRQAMDDFKRDNRRPYPTWTEVLAVLMALGYARAAGAPRYNRSKPDRPMRSQRPKPAAIPFPKGDNNSGG